MKQIILLVLLISSFIFTDAQTVCSYKYRKRITFDPTKVSGPSDLNNFNALIKITSDNDLKHTGSGGHVENTNGYDIMFTAADGITVLSHQMESYTSTSGQYTAWVQVPILSTSVNTYIYLYYGNSSVTTDPSTTSIWSNYYSVYHFQNNNFNDQSPSGYNLTNQSTTNQSPAFIGDGRAMTGTQYMDVSSSFPNITGSFTISGWMYTTAKNTAGQRVFCDDRKNTGGYALNLGDPGTGRLRFYSRSTNPVSLDIPSNSIANNTWYHVAAVHDASTKTKYIYVNGVLLASGTYTNSWGTDAGLSSVGGETAGGETANRFRGRLDEIRVSQNALNADWLLTEYNNQNSPTTFYSISAEPKVWTGGSNTNWNASANWLNNSRPSSTAPFDDVIITNGSNQPTMNGTESIKGLWVYSGATLSQGANTLNVSFDILNCGTISGNTGTIVLNSTNNEILDQYLSGSGTYNLNNLTVNNTYSGTPTVRLNNSVNVSGALTLTSGIVYTTSSNILNLGSSSSSSSGSATSFVDGPMTKTGTTNFIFPVGKGSKWRRASLTNISSSSTYSVEYFNTPYSSLTPVNSPLYNVSQVEYWQINRTSGSGDANVALYWEDAAVSGITNCADLTIARWNGASWDEQAATTVGGSTCTGSGTGSVLTNSLISAFSPWTFASKSAGVNPLPVELLFFDAQFDGANVECVWQTASEQNSAHFIVQRSADGIQFENIGLIPAAGHSNILLNYHFTDTNPLNGISYYRLMQTDMNGAVEYFGPVAVQRSSEELSVQVFPNPASSSNATLVVQSKSNLNGEIKIVDVTGRLIHAFPFNAQAGFTSLPLNTSLAKGHYFILLESAGELKTARLIIE